jgi:glycosyltransferase involved in cell wall biosynthesis
MKQKLSVTIGICAHNEQATIGAMLACLLKQKGELFTIEKIIVMDDCSSDKTVAKARAFMKKNHTIKLVTDKQRIGKVKRLNMLYKLNSSDILITFDADILLGSQLVVENMVKEFVKNKNTVMVAAHQVPIATETFVGRVIHAGYRFWDVTRLSMNGGDHIQNHYGAATAYRKSFISNIQFPSDITDDRGYLYIMAKKEGNFVYTYDAVILYRAVGTFHDFIKLADRSFEKNERVLSKYFGKEVYDLYKIPRSVIVRSIIKTFLQDPVHTVFAILLNAYSRFASHEDKLYEQGMWETSYSTKKSIQLSKMQ